MTWWQAAVAIIQLCQPYSDNRQEEMKCRNAMVRCINSKQIYDTYDLKLEICAENWENYVE